jgi:hypothetical protein
MNLIRPFLLAARHLFEKYPAVLSGYFLYGYLFVSMIRLFIKAKRGVLLIEDIYDIFSSLLILWLLALSCVKILEERSKLRQTQEELAREQQRHQVEDAHAATMTQVEGLLPQGMNNPLAVIALSIARVKYSTQLDHDLPGENTEMKRASKKPGIAVTDFSGAQVH